MRCLAHGRIHIAALCVGLMQRLVDESATWAATRRQSGHRIGEFQLVQGMLADSQTDLVAARAGPRSRLRLRQRRRPAPGALVRQVLRERGGLPGGRPGGADPRRVGLPAGIPVERLYRDARLFRLYEGTSQIQQLIIARQVLRGVSHENA